MSASAGRRGNAAVTPGGISAGQPEPSAATCLVQDICLLLVENADEGMCGLDSDGIVTFVNPALTLMTGWAQDELLGKPYQQFAANFSVSSEQSHHACVRRGEDALLLRKAGGSFPAAHTSTSVFRDGRLWATVAVFHDISEKRRAEQWELTRSAIFSAILSNQALLPTLHMLADAFVARYPAKSIAILLRKGSSLTLEAVAGWPQPVAYPAPVSATMEELLISGLDLAFESCLMSASGEDRGTVAIFDREGGVLDDAIRGTIQRVCDLACVAIEHQNLYQEVIELSHADPTQASSARQFLEKGLRPAMAIARQRKKSIAVGCLDLDRLKQINGSLGPDYGLALAKAVSERLNQSMRDADIPMRYTGDSFLFALCDLDEPAEAEEVCQRLLRELRLPFSIKGHSLASSASVGISIFPQHGDTPGLLLRQADIALQMCKRQDRGGVQVYSTSIGQQNRRAAEIPGAFLVAIEKNQFSIAYQPIYTTGRRLAGFEALLRWKHPEWGNISPLEFIPIAERTGFIVPLGDWVIREVCRQVKAWGADTMPGLKFFANVSGVQLERPDFASKIAETLRRCDLSPDRLEIEITESWIISDLKGAALKLLMLRDLGIGIAIDDFGTGYATFNYLQELPLDTIKIDRSFIQRLDGADRKPSAVRAIIGMAQHLGLKLVAEGVETATQVSELADIGCDLMQGFFLAPPLTPDEAFSLLENQASRDAIPALEGGVSRVSAEFSETRP